jgi:4-amino-4-deoxy-L-arabinose transferase-like glycosyltransferase
MTPRTASPLNDGRSRRSALVIGLLFGVVLAVQLFGDLGGTPLLDYDEAVYADVSRNMYLDGEWLTPSLDGEPFYEKPPLLYWTQFAGYELFGVGALGARFSTAVSAALLLALVFFAARRPLGSRAAGLAALMLACCLMFPLISRVAFTDMLLTFFLALTLCCLHQSFENWDSKRGLGWLVAACTAAGLAMLVKGAIGALLPGAAALVTLLWNRRLGVVVRRVTWVVPSLLWMLLVGVSWYLMLGLTHPDGFEFMVDLFLKHHVGRFSEPMQGHGGSIVYYPGIILVGFLPWSPFLFPALRRTKLMGESDERARFLRLFASFAVITLVFFSIAATKLPNYIFPIFPCLALLTADLFVREGARDSHDDGATERTGRGWRIAAFVAGGFLILHALLLTGAPFMADLVQNALGEAALKEPGLRYPTAFGVWPFVGAAVLLVGGVSALRSAANGRPTQVARALALGAATGSLVLVLVLLPLYDGACRAPLRNLATQASQLVAPGEELVLVGLRHRPSISYYSGVDTRYVSRSRKRLHVLFEGPGPTHGLVLETDLPRILEKGPVEILAEERGYVLFRCAPLPERGG